MRGRVLGKFNHPLKKKKKKKRSEYVFQDIVRLVEIVCIDRPFKLLVL